MSFTAIRLLRRCAVWRRSRTLVATRARRQSESGAVRQLAVRTHYRADHPCMTAIASLSAPRPHLVLRAQGFECKRAHKALRFTQNVTPFTPGPLHLCRKKFLPTCAPLLHSKPCARRTRCAWRCGRGALSDALAVMQGGPPSSCRVAVDIAWEIEEIESRCPASKHTPQPPGCAAKPAAQAGGDVSSL